VPYEPGRLEAIGYREGKRVTSAARETTGLPAAIGLSCCHVGDIVNVMASACDDTGRAVPTADNLVTFEVTGPAEILGVGNGDPSSLEPDRATRRKLFNGLAACIVQTSRARGEVVITATSPGLKPAHLARRIR
jgi:beta-galactosidase